jgi:hypothetical protein
MLPTRLRTRTWSDSARTCNYRLLFGDLSVPLRAGWRDVGGFLVPMLPPTHVRSEGASWGLWCEGISNLSFGAPGLCILHALARSSTGRRARAPLPSTSQAGRKAGTDQRAKLKGSSSTGMDGVERTSISSAGTPSGVDVTCVPQPTDWSAPSRSAMRSSASSSPMLMRMIPSPAHSRMALFWSASR